MISAGFASLQAQHNMVSDPVRVLAYRSAIARHARGRSVLEIGCGTGILSIFAAQAGARRVVAIEETAIAELAREMIRANGCEDVVELIVANSRDVALDEPADLIIHELIGIDPLAENVIGYMNDARERFLAPGGRFLPSRLEVLCAGVYVPDTEDFITREQAVREGRELAGLYGLDLSPFLHRIERGPEFRRGIRTGRTRFHYPILSAECRLYDLDFASDLRDAGAPVATDMEIEQEGELNALVIYFRAHLDETIQLTNAPHAPKTCWGWLVRDVTQRVHVRPGECVRVCAELDAQNQLTVDLVERRRLEIGGDGGVLR